MKPNKVVTPVTIHQKPKKGEWSTGEITKLTTAVQKYIHRKDIPWTLVAQEVGTRLGKQCRDRYLRQSASHDDWTTEELNIIKETQKNSETRNHWAFISKHHLPHRSANAIKNKWNSGLKNKENPLEEVQPNCRRKRKATFNESFWNEPEQKYSKTFPEGNIYPKDAITSSPPLSNLELEQSQSFSSTEQPLQSERGTVTCDLELSSVNNNVLQTCPVYLPLEDNCQELSLFSPDGYLKGSFPLYDFFSAENTDPNLPISQLISDKEITKQELPPELEFIENSLRRSSTVTKKL